MPISRRLWPFMPRKETVERSGTLSAASPPTSPVGCARAQVVSRRNRVARVADALARPRPMDANRAEANWADANWVIHLPFRQVRITNPPRSIQGVTTCAFLGGRSVCGQFPQARQRSPPEFRPRFHRIGIRKRSADLAASEQFSSAGVHVRPAAQSKCL